MNRALVATLCVALCATAAPTEVVDDAKQTVSLRAPAERIVTLAPHATELVAAAGAGHLLVAIAGGVTPPKALAGLPRIGGPGVLDRERLLALQPDLVIGWQSGNRATDLDWVARQGIALYRTEPRELDDIAAAIRAIGRLAGTSPQAERGAKTFEAIAATACTGLPPHAAYVAVWDRPALSIGGRHWLNAVLTRAGYRNVLADVPAGAIRIAPEAQIGFSGLPRISLVRQFDDSPRDRLADLLSRPGPRLAEAVQQLCARRRSGPGSHAR